MQLTWLLDITGIPQNWRVLEGHSVNTFVLVNKEGKETLVKMHFFPKGGAKFMNDEEAQMVGAENMRHSHATLGAAPLLGSCPGRTGAAWVLLSLQVHGCSPCGSDLWNVRCC